MSLTTLDAVIGIAAHRSCTISGMNRTFRTAGFTAAMAVVIAASCAAATAPTPHEHLGRAVGTDFKLADWSQVSGYFKKLAAASVNLHVVTVGRTTEGRDFDIAVISSAANLDNLEQLKRDARRIADPRGLDDDERRTLLDRARVILVISCNMHSTEIGSPEMAMQLGYQLATSDEEPWKSARDEVVVVLAPSLNPDGLDRVVSWYRETRDTPYEAARLPELYQHYAGHDNNRDWFLLSLEETRIVTRLLYREWFPQVYWDVHQQGSSRERLFVPPYRDPLNPNLDPGIVAGIGALGSRMMLDLTREGLTGVSTGVTYDMWWNGGNRSVPVRHNIMGILTEAASANLASPIFLPPRELDGPRGIDTGNRPSNRFPAPWPGGWWRVADIARYELAVARSLLRSLASEREYWLRGALEAAERSIARGQQGAPYAWLIPPGDNDRDGTERLLDVLLLGGLEIDQATAAFEAGGRSYPAGTLVLHRAQGYGAYLQDLFEVQRYPKGAPAPYDVTGWTVPLLLGVRRVEVVDAFEVATTRVTTVAEGLAALRRSAPKSVPYGHAHLDGNDTRSLAGVATLLAGGVHVAFDGRHDSGRPGAWVVATGRRGLGRARSIVAEHKVEIIGAEGRAGDGRPLDEIDGMVTIDRMPRVGVYAPWTSNMDEGWTRWVLDRYQIPYTRVRNETVRAGRLRGLFDVLILPSVSAKTLREGRAQGTVAGRYAGGLDPEGSVAIDEFVRSGGTLIAFERAGEYVVDLFSIPIENVAKGDDSKTGFSCPGSILRAVPSPDSVWTAGLPRSQPIFFSRSRAYREVEGEKDDRYGEVLSPESLLELPASRVLWSGWIRSPETVAGASVWLRVPVGDGQIHLFGFRPQYRSWSHTTFKLLGRAMLLPTN